MTKKLFLIIITSLLLTNIFSKEILAQGKSNIHGCAWSSSFGCVATGAANCNVGFSVDTAGCNSQSQASCPTKLLSCIKASTDTGDIGGECGAGSIDTAIGCFPINDTNKMMAFLLGWGIGIAGGIAFLLIIVAGFQISSSAGDPKKLQAGKELLMSAVGGLVFLILSAFILRIIGVNILGIFQAA